MSPDTALRKKPQCLTGVGAFLDSENLYFQGETSVVIGIMRYDWLVLRGR
jgi:hypothetical protein